MKTKTGQGQCAENKRLADQMGLKTEKARSCMGREMGLNMERVGDGYEQNIIYEILKVLMKIFLNTT